jgi:hypothetical protein
MLPHQSSMLSSRASTTFHTISFGSHHPRVRFRTGILLAVPSNAQDEGEEEPDAAGSTPGSPPPMLNPAST